MITEYKFTSLLDYELGVSHYDPPWK